METKDFFVGYDFFLNFEMVRQNKENMKRQ